MSRTRATSKLPSSCSSCSDHGDRQRCREPLQRRPDLPQQHQAGAVRRGQPDPRNDGTGALSRCHLRLAKATQFGLWIKAPLSKARRSSVTPQCCEGRHALSTTSILVFSDPHHRGSCFARAGCRCGGEFGVRHRIDVVVSAEPDAPIFQRLRGAKGKFHSQCACRRIPRRAGSSGCCTPPSRISLCLKERANLSSHKQSYGRRRSAISGGACPR